MAPREDRLMLTEKGAALLSAWLDEHGERRADLGRYFEAPNDMQILRALRRKGGLSARQIGLVVAFTSGELTAAQLVGREAARVVPRLPARERPKPREPIARAALPEGWDAVAAMKRMTPENLRALAAVRDNPKAPTAVRIRAIETLLAYALGKPRAVPKKQADCQPPVDEAALIAKIERLMADARAKLEEEEKQQTMSGACRCGPRYEGLFPLPPTGQPS